MARKHNIKRRRIKQPIQQHVIAKATSTRSVKLIDGEFKAVTLTTPAITQQGRALGSTMQRQPRPRGRRSK